MKVLFAQEQPFLAVALKCTLIKKGFDLVISKDTQHPVSDIEKVNPSVVIADLSTVHGFQYLEEAKKKNVPVIVISANGKEDDLQKAFDKGADDYVTLPLSLSDLSLRVSILTMQKLKASA